MIEAGISKQNVIYVMGVRSSETVMHHSDVNNRVYPIKLDYDGQHFDIPEWTVEKVANNEYSITNITNTIVVMNQ